MTPSIRRATLTDQPAMVDLLLRDARQRERLEPSAWRVAADARARIETAVAAALDAPNARMPEWWHVAEAAGRVVGVTHTTIVHAPPIYAVTTPTELFFDDCCTAVDAPPGTREALLEESERALRAAGAYGLVASTPIDGPFHPLYQRRGYAPVTLYLAKSGFVARDVPAPVRAATADDVPGIVERSADHRRTLAALQPRFWPTHADANGRFEAWMRYSLTLTDRDMFVAGAAGHVRGYVIAQPIAALLLPTAHDAKAVGVIDDFHDDEFANVATASHDGVSASKLLSTAETAFARRGVTTALAICPAAWTSKVAVLEGNGYRRAKQWMFKQPE